MALLRICIFLLLTSGQQTTGTFPSNEQIFSSFLCFAKCSHFSGLTQMPSALRYSDWHASFTCSSKDFTKTTKQSSKVTVDNSIIATHPNLTREFLSYNCQSSATLIRKPREAVKPVFIEKTILFLHSAWFMGSTLASSARRFYDVGGARVASSECSSNWN